MKPVDVLYAELVNDILRNGSDVTTRNSPVKRLVGKRFEFTRTPLVGVRRTAWKNCLREWEWFMSGSHDINCLHPAVRNWWQPWANDGGFVPFNYSVQFRNFYGVKDGVDQIQYLIDGVTGHPYSRRNVITTWNTADMMEDDCPITNCHGTVVQAFVEPEDDALTLVTYQRSADVVCGLPHNWLQYWAFLLWLAYRGGRKVGGLVWVGGDCHVYAQHYGLAERMAAGAPHAKEPPELLYAPTSWEFLADDFTLGGPYEPLIDERAEMVV